MRQGKDSFVYPRYGQCSLTEIVPSIFLVLGTPQDRPTLPKEFYQDKAEGCSKVLLFFVDGLGYEQVRRYCSLPLFHTLLHKGRVNPITTVFPSTTAAAVSAIHTGLSPQEHGIPEWTVYFEELGRTIQTIPFRFANSKNRDGLAKAGIDPTILYNGPTVYEQLGTVGIPSYVFLPEYTKDSAYSSVMQRGSEIIHYTRASDLPVKVRNVLRTVSGPAYFHVYWGGVDTVGHEFGPHKEEHQTELSLLSHLLVSEFFAKLKAEEARDVLFLLTADHGQINVTTGEKLLHLEDLIDLRGCFKKNKYGRPIQPTGCARDVFLHIENAKLEYVFKELTEKFSPYAEVMLSKEAFERGMFGLGTPHEKFLSRIGDILILPYDHYLVWNKGFTKDPEKFVGIHGGLSPEEMLIPFAAARLSDLCLRA